MIWTILYDLPLSDMTMHGWQQVMVDWLLCNIKEGGVKILNINYLLGATKVNNLIGEM